MSGSYRKCINLSGLKHNGKDVLRLENIILRLGYTSSDYKINAFNESHELIVMNQDLHRDLKTIRRTNYGNSK